VYNRQLAAKWSPDGFQRVIRTAPLVSGESTTSDAATRSRYPHVQLSESKRLKNHLPWFTAHHEYFFLFFREVLLRREEFVRLVFAQVQNWMDHPDLQSVPTRERVTHSVCYAAFAAATVLFQSHGLRELSDFRKFVTEHARSAAADVQTDVNVNVFVQDMLTAFKAGAIKLEHFRVESVRYPHPPNAPNQGEWESVELYMDPDSVIADVQIFLTKQRQSVALRQKDLRDQLSKHPFWVTLPGRRLNKRFGPKGQMRTATAWGFRLDLHPLGYQALADEEFAQSLSGERSLAELGPGFRPFFKDGDPRRGPLYAIVDAVNRWRAGDEG
jgi:hypothetical protein